LDEGAFKQGERKMPRKAATALAAVLVFFGAVPAVLADANNQTDHHGLSAQRPVFGYAFIFFGQRRFPFLEDAPVVLVSFVLWDSVRAPRERSLRFES
jgi:hypothetical protein